MYGFVTIDGTRLKTKEIEIDWEEWDEQKQEWTNTKKKLKIRKLMGGERDDIVVDSMPTKITGGVQSTNPNYKMLKNGYLLKGIVSAPFSVDKKGVESIESNLSDYLFQEILEFNNLSDKKKANSD